MANQDPSKLVGPALMRWYRRSSEDQTEERRREEARRYDEFFGQLEHNRFDRREGDNDPVEIDVPSGQDLDELDGAQYSRSDITRYSPPLDEWESLLIQIGNPANRRLRRGWEKKEGRDWPVDPKTGRKDDVGHIRAKADGGTDTLDNIRPVPPAEHQAEHQRNGDFARWARRRAIAEAFGGKVGKVLGPLNILSSVTGLLSGRIRTDKPENFIGDMFGVPTLDDRIKALERDQRQFDPNWKLGDPLHA